VPSQIIPTAETATSKPKVLFVCTRNSARSQIGEGLLRHLAGDRFAVFSAGLQAAPEINPFAIEVMAEIGIDIRSQRPKATKEYMGRLQVDALITVCAETEEDCPRALWTGKTLRLNWVTDDPSVVQGSDEDKRRAFREVRDILRGKIEHWLQEPSTQDMLNHAAGTTA
jgi:arsenate reductase (thioredoxin)